MYIVAKIFSFIHVNVKQILLMRTVCMYIPSTFISFICFSAFTCRKKIYSHKTYDIKHMILNGRYTVQSCPSDKV